MMLRIISIAILLVCCVQPSYAEDEKEKPKISTDFTYQRAFSQLQFYLIPPGARASGMGGAFIGLADDATAAESNPAGLTQLKKPQVFADFAYITYTTKQIYENYYSYTDIRWEEWDKSVKGAVPFISLVYPYRSFAFSFYYQEMINYKMGFQTSGRWLLIPLPDRSSRIILPIKSDIKTMKVTNFGIGAALQLHEKLSVAVSPRLSVLGMELDYFSYFGSKNPNFVYPSENPGDFGVTDFSEEDRFYELRIADSDTDFGMNVGILWLPDPHLSFGLVYRKEPKFTLKQDISQHECPDGFDAVCSDLYLSEHGDNAIDLEVAGETLAGGIAARLLNNSLTLTIDVSFMAHSVFSRIEDFGIWPGTETRFGVEYLLILGKRQLALRGGIYHQSDHTFQYIENLADPLGIALFPGGDDELHLTGGLGLIVDNHLQIDMAANIANKTKHVSVSARYRF